jgi:hypothetical protein
MLKNVQFLSGQFSDAEVLRNRLAGGDMSDFFSSLRALVAGSNKVSALEDVRARRRCMSDKRWYEALDALIWAPRRTCGHHRAAQELLCNRIRRRFQPRDPLMIRFANCKQQVRELQAAVAGMRSDWQQARAETAELRRELDELRAPRTEERR